MPLRPIAPLLDATTRHRKASAYSILAGIIFGSPPPPRPLSSFSCTTPSPPEACPVCSLSAHTLRGQSLREAGARRCFSCRMCLGLGRVGWLVWIDAAVRGPYLSTPDGWSTIFISCVPIAICSLFLLALNVTETDDLRQLCNSYSFGLQQGRGANILLALSTVLAILAIGSSIALLIYFGTWLRSPGETWLAAAAAAATQFVFVAAIVFWVGRSHNATLL